MNAFQKVNNITIPYVIVERREGDIANIYAYPAHMTFVLGYRYDRLIELAKENDNKILTTKDNIYDIVCPNCFDINSINEYLNKGIKENNNYKIYLKDIILAEKGDEYITITTDNNQIYADYTSLLQVFNNQIVKYTVNIKIEE